MQCDADRLQQMLISDSCRWSMMLPAGVQVCPVEIPGRGRRANEAAINDVHQLADLLAAELPLQVRPYGSLLQDCQLYKPLLQDLSSGVPLPSTNHDSPKDMLQMRALMGCWILSPAPLTYFDGTTCNWPRCYTASIFDTILRFPLLLLRISRTPSLAHALEP